MFCVAVMCAVTNVNNDNFLVITRNYNYTKLLADSQGPVLLLLRYCKQEIAILCQWVCHGWSTGRGVHLGIWTSIEL